MNRLEALARLQYIIADVEADLAHLECRPELMRDASGRYILLDAYAALVMALSYH